MAIQAPKGTKDVLPGDSHRWQRLEEIMRGAAQLAGYREIRTPVFEHTELFLRGVGDTTDVVQKEMYTFLDKGERSITLKPEGTAGAVRAFIESGLAGEAMPQKFYYLYCPVFRYENPQSGRLREHHQFGVEAFGAASPQVDADVVSVAMNVFETLGLKDLSLTINSIGCPQCRPHYQQMLKDYFRPHLSGMCKTCQDRFERNPLRMLDCKEDTCKQLAAGAPSILDALCGDCQEHFDQFKGYLEALGYPYVVDPGIVRGLDYYTRSVFEVITMVEGKPLTICAGGRYDGLVETIGGPSLPGVGYGMGMERVLMVAQAQGVDFDAPPLYDVYIATSGDRARKEAFMLVHQLRAAGLRAETDVNGRSLKAQFKYCGKNAIPRVVVLGDDELDAGMAKVRDMSKGQETSIALADLVQAMREDN